MRGAKLTEKMPRDGRVYNITLAIGVVLSIVPSREKQLLRYMAIKIEGKCSSGCLHVLNRHHCSHAYIAVDETYAKRRP